jgi:hypothetical protein
MSQITNVSISTHKIIENSNLLKRRLPVSTLPRDRYSGTINKVIWCLSFRRSCIQSSMGNRDIYVKRVSRHSIESRAGMLTGLGLFALAPN